MPRLPNHLRTFTILFFGLYFIPGSADGSFRFVAPNIQYDTQYDPLSVASGDFDNDGTADFATANSSSNSVSVFLGQGDGLLAFGVNYSTGDYPVCVQTSDLDQDGHLDLVLACQGDNSVTLLWGSGDGTFPNRTDLPLNSSPNAVAVGDLDGFDSYPDLAVPVNSGDILVFQNSAGSFGSPSSVNGGFVPSAISISDMNVDGHNDLVVTGIGVSVFMGLGNASFDPPVTTTLSYTLPYMTTAFIDHDGYPDVCVASDSTVVLLGNGDGTFTFGSTGDPIYAYGFAIGDFDRDGHVDLAAADGDIVVAKGNGDGTFGEGKRFFSPATSILATDLDGDTRIDLVTTWTSLWGALVTLKGYGDGNFGLDRKIRIGTNPGTLVAEDLNEDGRPDLLVPDQDSGGLVLRYGELGGFGPEIRFQGTGGFLIKLGDINGDTIKDAVVSQGNAITVYLGSVNGVFGTPTTYSTEPLIQSLAIGDVNQDGYQDVAGATADKATVWLGHSNGTLTWLQDYPLARTPIVLDDLNEDGQLDLISLWPYSVELFPGNGDGTFGQRVESFYSGVPQVMGVADVNGDNHKDLVWGGPAGDVGALLGDGQGAFQDTQPDGIWSYVDGRVEDVEAADFDLDGKLDLAVMNASRAVVTLFQGVGDGTFVRAIDLGIGQNVWGIALADFDQDGDSDIAVSGTNWGNPAATGVTMLYNLIGAQVGVESPMASLPPLRLLTNPARGRLSLEIDLEREEFVRLEVLDLSGRRVSVPMNGLVPAGSHKLTWRGESDSGLTAPSGVYVIRVTSGGKTRATKAVWLRR